MSDLYDADIVEWSDRQAELLRRRAANELDWDNIAEEIEDVGRSEWHAVEALLGQAVRQMLKAVAWPQSRDAPLWRADAIDFRQQARRRFATFRARQDRRGEALCRRAAGTAGDDRWRRAAACAAGLPGDAGRTPGRAAE